MIVIEFNHLDEFLDELTLAKGAWQVFGPVRSSVYAKQMEVMSRYYIQAFYLSGQSGLITDHGDPVGGYVPVMLKMFVGDVLLKSDGDTVQAKIDEIQATLAKACENLGIEVRKGRLADV